MWRKLVNFAQERLPSARSREALNRLVTTALPKSLPLVEQARPLLEKLGQYGNVYLPELVSRESLLALRRDLEEQVCYDPWRPESGDFRLSEAPENANNARIRNVVKFPIALAVANHPLVLSIVSNYLGCLPTIDDIVAWWSIPGRPAPKEEQFFHRDRDAVKFVKLFVYLGDVGPDDGAHEFVAGSHRDDVLLERRGRYLDEEVFGELVQENALVMTGPFGTAFLEDTYGLHKGGVPARDPRLVLQVRYTSYPSNWARRAPAKGSVEVDTLYNPYVNRFVA